MIPGLSKGDLSLLPKQRQSKICIHTPQCTMFMTIFCKDEDILICSEDAKEFAFEIFGQLGMLTKAKTFPYSKYGWTTEQERFIKNYIKSNNVMDENGKLKYGVCGLLGEMLNKSREQVKQKIQHMRKEGKL